MHGESSDQVRKSIRTYLLIGGLLLMFTVITVAASYIHLAIPAAITLALIIAAIKGSMVAAVFMHLSHEARFIYGTLLLTAVFFAVLMLLPILTTSDTFGTHTAPPPAAHGAAETAH
jgi:cytochrome c oxidase subunit 4